MIYRKESGGLTLSYDTEALTVTMTPAAHLGLPETVRPMTDDEHVGVAAYAFDVVRVANQAELRDLDALRARFQALHAFQTNDQVVAYRGGAAGLTLTATQLNALLRSTLDALEDVSRLAVALAKAQHLGLCDDISDAQVNE